MANRSLHPLLLYLRRLGGSAGEEPLEDAQLLHRFLTSRDESAFTMIVQRYGAMVWGLCVRRLGETPEAEDAFQATFLVLVRKAASLRVSELLGPWLYGVANRTALKLRGKRTRQATRETALPEQLADERPEQVWAELRPVLDEEINRLPAKYRLPVVLCYLQGLSSEEAAQHLGCAKGTIFSRLSRARDLLRRRLIRRGLDVSAGAVAAVLAENAAVRAMPPMALREMTIRTSLLLAAGTASQAMSAPLAALVEGVVRSMFLSKVKFVAVAVLAIGIAGAGAGFLGHRTDAEPPAAKQKPKSVLAAVTDKPKGEPAQVKPKGNSTGKLAGDAPMDMASRLKEWRDKLHQPIDVKGYDNPKITLTEILDSLAQRYDLVFEVNERAFKFDGIMDVGKTPVAEDPIPPMKASLAKVLRTILARVPAPSGATYLFRLDHVEITTTTFVWAELDRPPERGENPESEDARQFIFPRERSLMWDAFEDTPIAQVLQRIVDTYGLNLVTDPRVAKQLQIKATANFNNVPVETVLRLLLNMADVSMVRIDNVFYLTTAENAEHLREEQAKINRSRMGEKEPPAKPAPEKRAK